MDWVTVLPPVVAIIIVFWKKEVILALLLSLFTSEIITIYLVEEAHTFFLFDGVIATIDQVVEVFSSPGNVRLLMFSTIVGALMALMRYSGGVTATVKLFISKGLVTNQQRAGLVTFFTGAVIFIESNLSVLTAGIISRGFFDKFKMSRARLAYIIDSTSAPICILILLNGWGAYILGLLGNYQLPESSISILISTIPLNFYAILTLIVVLYTIITGKVYGPLKQSEETLTIKDTELSNEVADTKARFMIIPLITLVFGMLAFMFWTGNGNIVNGSGSLSVLYASLLACLVGYFLMISSGDFTHQQVMDIGFKGMSELLPLVTIVLLSLALGSSLQALGTGEFISGIVADNLPLYLIPTMLFLAGALISFTTGTSWGTFAILIPIGMPIVINLGLDPALVLAAIMGGGVFGDHCSPISDTTAVSAVASGCDLLEHVKTQLPYALFCGVITIGLYILVGYFFI
ncbi:Na+/H+ antiporter NhaC family protein [Colwellia sp. RSH04]|uniref:Na+/H+ antiporter NhaC family protein n=1 Tax=Colwellia sp. RSH04 TaxID=2305464 RepID=UPI000E56CE0F|nr:Na+/H+ antiporter NhaC family protein [Colwellia sp. RSH04]RHW76495.1 sodium:proton antiporter [Colwellia sp. RSH04]